MKEYDLDPVDEEHIKMVFDADNVTSEFMREMLLGTEVTEKIQIIGQKYNLNMEKSDSLIREVGYILLKIKSDNTEYKSLINALIPDEKNEVKQNIAKDLNVYINEILDRESRFEPLETKSGDKVVYSTNNGNFYITKDYFYVYLKGKFPFSYVRTVDLEYTSGFQELGISSSIGFIIIGALIGFASLSAIFSLGLFGFIFGVLGGGASYWIIKQPFNKARPRIWIDFHPNLNIDMVFLEDNIIDKETDVKDIVKILKKYM